MKFHASPEIYLVAGEIVPVYDSKSSAMRFEKGIITRQLIVDQRVQVVDCIDVKHYMIYKVKLLDGSFGFVNEGKYSLSGPMDLKHCD